MQTAHALLNGSQVSKYQREGYLLYQNPVFPAQSFAELTTCFESLLALWLREKRCVSPEHMDVPHFYHPELFRWLLDDAVLDLVEPLLGPDIALFSSHFICKPAGKSQRVPWHEDGWYWRSMLAPMEVVTVWLALDPSTPENGCMQVVSGSHLRSHGGNSDYTPVADDGSSVFNSELRPQLIDQGRVRDCVLAPNQASLHSAGTIHGSAPNTGTQRRCGYTMRYISTKTRFITEGNDGFQLYLARGRDHAGNVYGDPSLPNESWIRSHGLRPAKGH